MLYTETDVQTCQVVESAIVRGLGAGPGFKHLLAQQSTYRPVNVLIWIRINIL